jgi:hypothetical protein
MAINKQTKTLAVAKELQTMSEQLMDVIERFPAMLSQINSSGLTFTDYDAQYAEQEGLKHVVGGDINSVVSGFNNIIAWFDEKDGSGVSLYRRDPFNKLRTGA